MQEVIEAIVKRTSFEKKDLFAAHLAKCFQQIKEYDDEYNEKFDKVLFKLDILFKGFSPFINEFGKSKKYLAGVSALDVICDELGVEMDPSECFILFHLRDLGKFKIREAKLHLELKSLWGQYKEYRLDDGEFSYALKSMMRKKFINYRKGNLSVNPSVLLSYRI